MGTKKTNVDAGESSLLIVVLDAHNDELEIRRVYMAEGKDGRKELVIATNAEPEQ